MIRKNKYHEINLVGRKDVARSLSWFLFVFLTRNLDFFSSDLSTKMHRHAQYMI